MTLLNAWMRDTGNPKVVRFPVFDAAVTPTIVIVQACTKYRRRPELSLRGDRVRLERR